MTYDNGDVYEGGWFNNERFGKGVLKQHDGIIYECQWKYDKKVGKGVKIVNGRRISGTFFEDTFSPTKYYDNQPRRRVDSNGRIYYGDDYLGRINDDGDVYDNDGNRVGKVTDNGEIRDSDGYRVGRLDDDGTLRNNEGYRKGNLDNGGVKDSEGYYKGTYEGDKKGIAAAEMLLK